MVLLLRIPIKVLGGKVGVRKLPGKYCLRNLLFRFLYSKHARIWT